MASSEEIISNLELGYLMTKFDHFTSDQKQEFTVRFINKLEEQVYSQQSNHNIPYTDLRIQVQKFIDETYGKLTHSLMFNTNYNPWTAEGMGPIACIFIDELRKIITEFHNSNTTNSVRFSEN